MPTFTDYTDILPDPNNPIGWAGQATSTTSSGGAAGPGFASVSLTSYQPAIKDYTNSGRILGRAIASQRWRIKINYNPMTRAEFEPIYTFLLGRRGPLYPFYVSLPQYRTPRDSTFATFSASNSLKPIVGYSAGTPYMSLGNSTASYSTTTHKHPLPGDLFHFTASNSNHKKAYMVTKVLTSTDYLSGGSQPQTNAPLVYFTPGLAKAVVAGDNVIFHNPLIKVIMVGDVQEYSLNTQNLYSFSLNLEEVQ